MVKKITERDRQVLRKLVNFTCQECGYPEEEVGELEIHRIKRGNLGGEYVLGNIKVVCGNCHKNFHANEEGCR